MSTKKHHQNQINELREQIAVMKAQMEALNAPHAIYNEVHDCWVFYKKPKLEKEEKYNPIYGKGYILLKKEAV